MSEHFQIKSKIDFHHLPTDEIGSMCYCQFCKKTFKEMIVLFHDGITSQWIEVRCGKCKKCVYTSKINPKLEVLNEKCYICKKKTSYFNAHTIICSLFKKRDRYICSSKCYKIYEKKNRE